MGKKGKKGKKSKKVKEVGPSPEEIAEMESALQQQVADVTEDIDSLSTDIQQLKAENLLLKDEASTLKEDTQIYVNEMRARSEGRQAILQGIQLLKQKQLSSLQEERNENKSAFQRRRAALQMDITARSQELVLAQKQLQDLEPVRRLQQEQNAKIDYLENKLEKEKDVYESQVLEMKRQLIRLKYSLQEELQRELDEVRQNAMDVAQRCLGTYVSRVREENGTLREQLRQRIEENKTLEAEFKRQSHVRNEQLRERSYRDDIIRKLQDKLRHV